MNDADETTTPDPASNGGHLVEAAVCYLRAALTSIHPDSPSAAAPVNDPPSDWPLAANTWTPNFSDPIPDVEQAVGLLALALDVIRDPQFSFDGARSDQTGDTRP